MSNFLFTCFVFLISQNLVSAQRSALLHPISSLLNPEDVPGQCAVVEASSSLSSLLWSRHPVYDFRNDSSSFLPAFSAVRITHQEECLGIKIKHGLLQGLGREILLYLFEQTPSVTKSGSLLLLWIPMQCRNLCYNIPDWVAMSCLNTFANYELTTLESSWFSSKLVPIRKYYFLIFTWNLLSDNSYPIS